MRIVLRVLCLVSCASCLVLNAPAMSVRAGAPSTAGGTDDYYPVAGGVSGREAAKLPRSSNSMRIEYRLASAEIGASLSAERPAWSICDFIAGDAIPENVDWVATMNACKADPNVASRVHFFESATDAERRVLFVGGGNVNIPWQLEGGLARTNGYFVGKTVSTRPCRLFWTDGEPADGNGQPYNAPPINLNGRFVEIFGEPDVLMLEYGPPSYEGGPSNIVRGVYVEPGSATLHAKAANGVGPKGQFVLAYYDTPDHARLLGVTTVEVLPPDPQVKRVFVGDRLLPTGGGYAIAGLTPIVQSGDTETFGKNGSDGSPWIEAFAALKPFSDKANAYYAIAPTDGTTGANGQPHSHDADIFWEAPDAMGTLWPFEEVCYEISWNPDDVKMVVSDPGDANAAPSAPAKLFVPTNYMVSVKRFGVTSGGLVQSIASVEGSNQNQINVTRAGRYLLKLTFDDDVRYLPIHAVDRNDPSVGGATNVTVEVGETLRPFTDYAVASMRSYAMNFRHAQDGRIETAANGVLPHVWNPNLYHEPKQQVVASGSPDDQDADPITKLKSAICLVKPTSEPVEVHWPREVTVVGNGEALPYPISVYGLVNRYVAEWPKVCHEIALTSQRGSAVPTPAPSKRAFRFRSSGDRLSATADLLNGGKTLYAPNEPLSFGLWVKPMLTAKSGRLASFQFDGATEIALSLSSDGSSCKLELAVDGGPKKDLGAIPFDVWTHVAVSIAAADREISAFVGMTAKSLGNMALKAGSTRLTQIALGGAADWAADEICVWDMALDANLLAGLASHDGKGGEKPFVEHEVYRFDGDAMMGDAELDNDKDNDRYTLDAQGRGVLKAAGRPDLLQSGAPVVSSGDVAESDGVSPRIYRQTEGSKPGSRFNYEHAFVANGSVWALRNDQSDDDGAYVEVEYADNGSGAMRVFRVIDDTETFPASSETVAGQQLAPPYPLRHLEGYWNKLNLHQLDRDDKDSVWHRDRKLNDWARCKGDDKVAYWYLPRETFDFNGDTVPVTDGFVPWRNSKANMDPQTKNVDKANCSWWASTVEWPSNAPVLYVGQTLTKPVNGLPEVWNMASCDVVYPKSARNAEATDNIVRLVDPVTAKTAALPIKRQFTDEYGFEVGPSGNTTLRQGKYYFPDLPPSIADRFYIDTNASLSNRVVLVGDLQEPAAGNPYLRWNLLSEDEKAALKELCTKEEAVGDWCAAIDDLAKNVLTNIIAQPHQPVANYALFADGHGSGYVSFIENDSTNTHMVAEGDPIDMKVIYVTNALYAGTCMTVQNKLNKLSELLTVQYNDAFPGMEKDFKLAWYRYNGGTPVDGNVPSTEDAGSGDETHWIKYTDGDDKTSFVLGKTGTTLSELVNTYYCFRYEPRPGKTCVTGGVTTDPALAEGWVQRVLNALTPFAQRVEDFYSNPSDLWYTMFEQIGKPYRGDVALNNDNLTEIGLLELYRTVFNKAWKLSLGSSDFSRDAGVDKQLMLAASRIADLYQLLGAEAYADAKNPLISQGFNDTYLGELQNLPSSTFCFQNQVRTLLDEELALLRGRELGDAPNMTTQPCYNRLYWNFTKGITEGEVAYVNNYGIRADQGVLTIDQAAKQYPQGHGDAWGHYLSSIQLYYRLLRNVGFDWQATKMEMNLSAAVANEDYYDEQKFADSAVKLAQIGLDTVDLTARRAWRDNAGKMRAGYADAKAEQAFGYGEWATRTTLGGLYNWVTINAIVPPEQSGQSEQSNDETGLNKIDRSTVTQLSELCTLVDQVQQKVNTVDSGLNPLGLSQNAVPMDIDPDELAAKNSHFDQILERAERALANCETVLAFANQYGARLQQIQNAETSAGTAQENTEATYNRDLIAIYGTPYPGDIGTGCLYPQGYDGPDLYHYMYMDLDEFGLSTSELEVAFTKTLQLYEKCEARQSEAKTNGTISVSYEVTSGGIIKKPPECTGVRRVEGKLQSAYRDYLTAYIAATRANAVYKYNVDIMKNRIERYNKFFELKDARLAFKVAQQEVIAALKLANKITSNATEQVVTTINDNRRNMMDAPLSTPSIQVTGPAAISINPREATQITLTPVRRALEITESVTKKVQKVSDVNLAWAETLFDMGLAVWDTAVEYWQNEFTTEETYLTYVLNANAAARTVQDAVAALSTAEAAYRAVVAEGEALQEERERIRKQQSNTATQYRYADMYNRVQRNNALTKYSTAFDVAQRYVWELAKVYDYETGLLSSDPQAGDKFLAEIVGSRQLGVPGVSTSQATDKGLYDIVNRMKENWAVLKGRLGVNNPANTATEFSLRYELFRIKPDETGDGAWQEELKKYWVDDLKADSDYCRYCQPLVSTAGPVVKEPGLVIPFSTVINNAENFFGKTLQGGDHAYSSADYATKVHAVGVAFDGYDALTVQTAAGLAADPNVYLVPVGHDYMRAPSGGLEPAVLAWNVVDQVLPLPYAVGSTQLDDTDWIATFSGLDGTRDSAAKIRRHSTFRANGETYATRLVGRSVWNDRWVLVIPASSLNANREAGLTTFIRGVKDIKLKIQAYSRSGN